MLISHYVEAIQTDITNLGQLGGDEWADQSIRLAGAVEPALRGRLLEAINEIVAEANESSPGLRLELRLAGDDVSLVRGETPVEATETATDRSARFALRLPEDLKALIEEHATRTGASANSYIVRALARELADSDSKSRTRSGRSMRGSGQS